MTDTKQTVTVQMELPTPPDGWEYTGEYRTPVSGEWFVDRGVFADQDRANFDAPYPILRKKKWYPKHGERVWTIGLYKATGNMYVKHITFVDTVFEAKRFEEGCYYRTEQAAQSVLDRVKSVLVDAADELNNQD